MQDHQEHLKREIGVFGLSANFINIIVGAGIFAIPAVVASGLGSASVFAYLFCGLLVALSMLCFAEIGAKVTTSGGAYTYIRTAFGPYIGFLTAIVLAISAITSDAAVANAFSDVIGSIFPSLQSRSFKIFFFILIFGGLGYINVRGVKEGMQMVKLITLAKLIPLLLLVLFSFREVSMEFLVIEKFPSLLDLGQMSLILFFAFQGGETALSVSGEVRDPQRTIPKAIFISITGVLILYLLIQTISQGVLGPELPNFKENTLGVVADHVFGPIGFTLITIGAAVSMFGTLSSEILSMPRVLYRASMDEVLPFKLLSKEHKKYATPYFAVIIYAGLGFIFAISGGFVQLAIISSSAILLIYLGIALSVIKLRRTQPSVKGEFKLPGGLLIPVLSCITIIWLLSNLSRNELFVFGLVLVGLSLIYLAYHKIRKSP